MAEPAPRQLILTLYGLYARDEHSWLAVSSVVRLMGELGVDGAGVRSSVSRLKRRGVLQAMRLDDAAGYALSDEAVELLREGDQRIFRRQRAVPSDGLVLVVFSIPESEREKRHQLRNTLSAMGFGTAAPGVWVAPGLLHDEVARTLERQGLAPYVDLFRASHDGFGSLHERVAEWWDLASIDREYAEFLATYAGAPARWRSSGEDTRHAFVSYVPMLTAWRRLPYVDPGLPLDLLPRGWNGSTAAELFAELDALLRDPAREHAWRTIHLPSRQPGQRLSRAPRRRRSRPAPPGPRAGTPRCRPSPGSRCRPAAATPDRSRGRARCSRRGRRCRPSRWPGRRRCPQRRRARRAGCQRLLELATTPSPTT